FVGLNPTSSCNSICGRVNKSSTRAASAYGTVHTPSSMRVKNGPPGCASRTSNSLFLRRNISRPALIRLRGDFEFSTASFYAGHALDAFCKKPADLLVNLRTTNCILLEVDRIHRRRCQINRRRRKYQRQSRTHFGNALGTARSTCLSPQR